MVCYDCPERIWGIGCIPTLPVFDKHLRSEVHRARVEERVIAETPSDQLAEQARRLQQVLQSRQRR